MTDTTDHPAPRGVLASLVADPDHDARHHGQHQQDRWQGVVDAVSILALGRVFVANMTGNVVFVGFALAGAPGFSLAASLSALAGFVVGANIGGQLPSPPSGRKPTLLRLGVIIELTLLVIALVVSAVSGHPLGDASRDVIAGVAAVALGTQNAVVRRLKVPDLTTTVLTMTLVGIAADIRSQPRSVVVRRILAVATMLAGAVAGALLVIHVSATAGLALAVGLLVLAFAAIAAQHHVL
jgi:uncharacterized membrane protein YoaK (UPF0700 family)